MTLLEMSALYADSAFRLRARIAALLLEAKTLADPEAALALRRRAAELDPLLREARELADLTAHYYERSYHKHERYTL